MNEHVMAILSAAGPVLMSCAGAMLLVGGRLVARSIEKILANNQREHEELADKLARVEVWLAQAELRFEDNTQEHRLLSDRALYMEQTINSHGERLTRVETRYDLSRGQMQ